MNMKLQPGTGMYSLAQNRNKTHHKLWFLEGCVPDGIFCFPEERRHDPPFLLLISKPDILH